MSNDGQIHILKMKYYLIESRYIFIWVSLKLMSFWYKIQELFIELIWIKLSFKKKLRGEAIVIEKTDLESIRQN